MRIIAITCIVLATALAGCSDSESTSDFVLKANAMPMLEYYDISKAEEQSPEFPSNPGSLNVASMAEAGLVSAYAAIFVHVNETDSPIVYSFAYQFNNATNAEMMSEMGGSCSSSTMLAMKGTYLAVTTVATQDDDIMEEVHTAFHKMMDKTGATDLCADHGEEHDE